MSDAHPSGGAAVVQPTRSDPLQHSGLTAVEAADRGSSIGRTAYQVLIDLTSLATERTFRVRTIIDFEAREPGRALWLDLLSADVESVEHNGCRLDPPSVVGPERIMLSAVAYRNRVIVHSTQRAGDQAAGLCRSVDPVDGEIYAWTQFQPFDARRMLPCFDQPDLRATFRVEVLAPRDWICVSNAVPVGDPTPAGPDNAHWLFAETPPIPVYLLALCAGPFAVQRRRHAGIPLGLYARRSLSSALDLAAPELFAVTAHGLDTYSAEFDRPFPGDSYDQVFLPDQPGAMENLGCVTWNDRALYRAPPTIAERARRALVLLHELSHQWFGDLVSPRWWDDLWLSESFADWAAQWALRTYPELSGSAGAGAGVFKAEGLRADQLPSTHPVSRAVHDMAAVEANFDAITYHKGACLLQQLVDLVGEQTFLAGLRAYFRRFAWSSATIDGLLDALDRAADVDVRRWAAEWLRTSGVNTVRAEVDIGDDGRYRAVTLRQNADPARPLLRSHQVQLQAFRLVDGTLRPESQVALQISGPATGVPAVIGLAAADLLLVDAQDRGFFKARLDPASLRVLLANGDTLPDAGPRAALRLIVGDMLFNAELDAPAAVRLLARCLGSEVDSQAFTATADLAVATAHRYAAPHRRAELAAIIADRCLELIGAASGPVPASEVWAVLAGTAATPDQLAALDGALAVGSLPASVRWDAVTRLIAAGAADPAVADVELRGDPDPDAWVAAESARAAASAPEAKQRALALLLDPAGVPVARIAQLAAGLWQPLQDAALADLAVSFLDRLPAAIAAGGTARALRLAQWGFPTSGLTVAVGHSAGALGKDRSLPLAVRVVLTDQAAVVERILRTAALPG